jgi:hypothetical protein
MSDEVQAETIVGNKPEAYPVKPAETAVAVVNNLPKQSEIDRSIALQTRAKINETIAAHAVKSGVYKGLTFSAAMMILQMADEIGIPISQALGSMHLVEGKLVMSANLIGALIQRSGRFRYKVLENTDKVCTIQFLEKIGEREGITVWDDLGKFSWTWEMAKRAGLATKAVWSRFPEAMLFSRAITQGVRMFCPMLTVVACYAPEEAEDFDKSAYKHQSVQGGGISPEEFERVAREAKLANS